MRLALYVLVVLMHAVSAYPAMADRIDEAESAYFRFELDEAQTLLKQVVRDDTAPLNRRVEAAQKMAAIEWRIRADADASRRLLRQADALGVKRAETQLILARIERERGEYRTAQAAAIRAHELADSDFVRHDAQVAHARALLSEALDAARAGQLREIDRSQLAKALTRVNDVLRLEPGRHTAARVAIGLAIVVGSGANMLDAWRAYFHVPNGAIPTSVLRESAHELAQVLPRWRGAGIDRQDLERLTIALADSRLFREAALVHHVWSHDETASPRVNDILVYEKFLRDVGSLTQDYYRAHAGGRGDKKRLRRGVDRKARALWDALQWPGDTPRYSFEDFGSEISVRFGAELEYKNANGHFGLHLGHRVIDEEREITQYGKSAVLRYVSLDFMVSNGYSSWFWDGRAEVGGWASEARFIQVREAYLDGGIKAWKQISDPHSRVETEAKIVRQVALDDSIARHNPHTFLPGLAERIAYHEYLRIREGLTSLGLQGEELRTAFIAEIDRLALEFSVFNHEGRHAIDKRDFFSFARSDADREFRAKLSEVTFSEAPFLALCGGILVRNIGDSTSHGKANQRLIEGLVRWMKAHEDEIEALDRTRPFLPQLDRLTPEQLREACRSMDPMASGR